VIKTAQAIKATVGSKMSAAGLAYLGKLVKIAPLGFAVDIGTYKGASALMMHKADPQRDILTIDDYTEGVDAKKRLELKIDPLETIRRMHSNGIYAVRGKSDVIPGLVIYERIALVFIDADHHGDAVRRDILAWRDLVIPGGIMAYDDYGSQRWPDVKPVVDELMDDWQRLGCQGSVAAFRRCG